MTIAGFFNFDSETRWATGAGCLTCGVNTSDLGREVGVQCVDLGIQDDFMGRFALCFDCALQVGRVAGMLPLTEAQAQAAAAADVLDAALEAEQVASEQAAQARLDKDTVERLLGSVYTEPATA